MLVDAPPGEFVHDQREHDPGQHEDDGHGDPAAQPVPGARLVDDGVADRVLEDPVQPAEHMIGHRDVEALVPGDDRRGGLIPHHATQHCEQGRDQEPEIEHRSSC